MRWSKLRRRVEAGFAGAARGRVAVWTTRYRGAHDRDGEGWITIDGTRAHSMGTLTFLTEFHERSAALQRERGCTDHREGAQIDGDRAASREAERRLEDEGLVSLQGFDRALFDALGLSVEEAPASERTVTRALAMFDRRLGRRRLAAMDVTGAPALAQSFHRIRCAFEGIRLPPGP